MVAAATTRSHPLTIIAQTLPNRGQDHAVGFIDADTLTPEALVANDGFDDKKEEKRVLAPDELPPLEACVNVFDYELVAQKKMALEGREKGWAYYSSGGDDETTLRDNMSAFHRIWLRPRILRDVSAVDPTTTILNLTQPDGSPFTFPCYLSSVALQRLGHPDGELAWIRACHSQGINYLLPTLSSVSYDEMYEEASGFGMNFMFQLYVNQDRTLVEDMVTNAESWGCKALFVTVDAPQLGRRDKDMRMKTVDASSVAQVQSSQEKDVPTDGGTTAAITSFIDPSLNWDDIEWMLTLTPMDIVLKGIQTGADAVMAKKMGVKGIVVSNHGGRQIDTARSGIEILPEVMEALRSEFSEEELEDFHVLLDGGVRRGTDIFKALALGARGCGIGKPAAYAMSAYGQPGIEQMLDQLKSEFANVMQLMGVTSVEQIRKEGMSMCDIRSLSTHVESSPTDYHYEPVNVFTHGKVPQMFGITEAGAPASVEQATATTTETTSHPDGTVTTTSTTTTGPATGGGLGLANNYEIPSTVPGEDPVRRVDFVDLEDLGKYADQNGEVKFCRCWKSKTFPLCDNSHVEHNEATGDNAAPMVLKGFDPIVKQLANNYGIPSTVPPDEPIKRVDALNVEDIASMVAENGDVKFCRCWKSANFPFCDDSHDGHNSECAENGGADNAAPVVLTSGLPEEKRGLDKVETLAEGAEPVLDIELLGMGRANNYGVPSNMPPGEPTKRVEIIDIEDIQAEVQAIGEVKFCRCWKSATFPFCDGSHDGHNLETGDNTGPVVLTPGSKM